MLRDVVSSAQRHRAGIKLYCIARCVYMLVEPLWCDLGCHSWTVVVIESYGKTSLSIATTTICICNL